MNVKILPLIFFAAVALSYPAGAVVVHHADFIDDGSRMGFSSYDSLPNVSKPGIYKEGGIQTEQVSSHGNIYAGCSVSCSSDRGTRIWYPNGGDMGYTRITLDEGGEFSEVGMWLGSGISGVFYTTYAYQLLLGGDSILFGKFTSFPGTYLGFSGGGFDEIRVVGVSGHFSLSYITGGLMMQAAAVDSVEIREIATPVPEPVSAGLIFLSVSGFALLRRRRRC